MNTHDLGQKLTSELAKSGLKEKEASIYAYLLEVGGAYPYKIAEATKINRTTTYKILETLSIKGLVSEFQKQKKLYYQIEKPERLAKYAKNQIGIAERQFEHATKLIPDLEGLFSLTANKPRVRFFEGVEGVLATFEEHLTQPKPYEMLGFSNTTDLIKFFPEKFVHRYIKTKDKLGITTRGLFPDTETDRIYDQKYYAGTKEKIKPKVRFIPKEMFPFKSEIVIFGTNKVSAINFTDNNYAATIIEDETIHGMMRMIFELAWNSSLVKE